MTTIGDDNWYIPFLSTTSAITGIYHDCLLPVHTTGDYYPHITTIDYYWYILPVTNTGIYYQCLLLVANIGDDDRYIPFLSTTSGYYRYIPWVSITSTYHQWPLLVYTTYITGLLVLTTGIYYQ